MRKFEKEREREVSRWIEESGGAVVRERFVVHHGGFDATVGVAKTRGFSGRVESDVAIEYGREFFSVEGVRVVRQVLRFGEGRRRLGRRREAVSLFSREKGRFVLVDETTTGQGNV